MKEDKPGKLILVPALLGGEDPKDVIPDHALDIIRDLTCFITENAKTARAMMKKFGMKNNFDNIEVLQIDKHRDSIDFNYYFSRLRSGTDTGLMSEAGMPGIADPGAEFVKRAHSENIQVVPLTGPSSIMLALSASGLNGQGFAFHGYLPKEKNEKAEKIKLLERQAKKFNQTQIFIETPYRNLQLFNELLGICQDQTLLCIAGSLTTSDEFVKTMPVRDWKKITPDITKKPVVFLLL